MGDFTHSYQHTTHTSTNDQSRKLAKSNASLEKTSMSSCSSTVVVTAHVLHTLVCFCHKSTSWSSISEVHLILCFGISMATFVVLHLHSACFLLGERSVPRDNPQSACSAVHAPHTHTHNRISYHKY